MLVQLSPWQTTKTSIGARKRRKPTTNAPLSLIDTTASFVQGQRRSRQRRKHQDDDMVPQVVLTASHKANLVGHLRSKSSSWQESAEHQYTSRPGAAFAFLGTAAFQIAAVMDGRKDKIYALQNENQTLISWNAADGPEAGQVFSLPAAARCLHTGHGLVYGSCKDGSAFIGQWVRDYTTKTDALQVQVFETSVDLAVHAHTVLEECGDGHVQVGDKRKASEMAGNFVLHQVFCASNQFTVVKTDFKLQTNVLEKQHSVVCHVKTDHSIDTSQIMASSLDESTLALVVRLTPNKEAKGPQFRALRLSLMTGQMGASIELPSTTRQLGGLSSSLLAIGTVDEVLVYDALHGTLLKVEHMTSVVSDTKDWRLVTDPKRSRMAVLSQQGGEVFVSLATLENSDEEYTLATGLQSISQIDGLQHEVVEISLLQSLDSSETTVVSEGSAAIPKALAALRICLDHILDIRHKEIQSHFFMEAYECSLATIVPTSTFPKKELHPSKSRPTNGKNGVHGPGKHTSPVSVDSRGHTPSSTPQEFIDGATAIILQVLQIPKSEDEIVGDRVKLARLDARTILLRLIRTGKVSARTHFESIVHDAENADCGPFLALLRSMKISQKKGDVVSAVDLMHEMLSSCPDLTERQLVTMVHYMLCRALPEDIAENFIDWKRFDICHPYIKASKAYFQELSMMRKLEKLNGASTNSPEMKQAQLQVAVLSTKLLRMGAAFLIERVVDYSDCNETLLRTALQQGLPLAHEPQLLLRLLLETLTNKRSRSSSKWIFALCEGCRDRLAGSEDGSSASTYDEILAKIKRIIQDGELIAGLAQYLGEPSKRTAKNIDLAMKPKVKKSTKSRKGKSYDEQVPDYCVEQLLF
jgi:hypothetical protein